MLEVTIPGWITLYDGLDTPAHIEGELVTFENGTYAYGPLVEDIPESSRTMGPMEKVHNRLWVGVDVCWFEHPVVVVFHPFGGKGN